MFDSFKNEIEVMGLKSIQFPHQLVNIDKTDWQEFLKCCDNYAIKDYIKGWQNGVAHEIIIGYWKLKGVFIKTMTSIFDKVLIGVLILDGQPVVTVNDSDIVLLGGKSGNEKYSFVFAYVLETLYNYSNTCLSLKVQNILVNEREISATIGDFKMAGVQLMIKSRYQVYSIEDLGKYRINWEKYLKEFGIKSEKETEFLVVEWLCSLVKTKYTFVDICAWPRDDHYGCICIDDNIIYTNSGEKLYCLDETWEKFCKFFEYTRKQLI